MRAAAGLRPLPRQASNRLRKLVGRFAPVAEAIKCGPLRNAGKAYKPGLGFRRIRNPTRQRPALTITMYGITTCDTIRKARVWLESHGVPYRFHDYRAEGIEAGKLDGWVGKVGWEKLLNKGSTTFRELPDADKEGLDEKKAKKLMLARPTMIKRPVLEVEDRVFVGFKPEVYAEVMGGK